MTIPRREEGLARGRGHLVQLTIHEEVVLSLRIQDVIGIAHLFHNAAVRAALRGFAILAIAEAGRVLRTRHRAEVKFII